MPLGDGVVWDETKPDNDTNISDGDNYIVHNAKATRLRMANEHEWPASQTGTGQAGQHKFITLQATTAPSALITGTQFGAISLVSSGTGYEFFVSSVVTGTTAGDDIQLTKGGVLGTNHMFLTGDQTAAGTKTFTTPIVASVSGDLVGNVTGNLTGTADLALLANTSVFASTAGITLSIADSAVDFDVIQWTYVGSNSVATSAGNSVVVNITSARNYAYTLSSVGIWGVRVGASGGSRCLIFDCVATGTCGYEVWALV